jgi:RNA polymerase sigma-70 factor, ECF subfamily
MNADYTILLKLHTAQRAVAPDDAIVSAAKAGSPEAFAELHARYSQRLYKTIASITRNSEDAEDALQETFLRAHVSLHTFEGRSSIYSWLMRIAINSALMVLRKRRARPEILFDPQLDSHGENARLEVKDSAPNPEEIYYLHQRRRTIQSAICKLDPHLRRPLQMRLNHGWSMVQISRALNLSVAAVKARLNNHNRAIERWLKWRPQSESSDPLPATSASVRDNS